MSSENTSATIVKTSLMAGLLGAGIALLLAPRSGNETQVKLRRAFGRMNHQAHDTAHDVVDSTRSGLEDMSGRLENIQQEMRMRRERRQQSPTLTNWEEEV